MISLLERLQLGDESAFIEIYNEYFDFLVLKATYILHDRYAAEDAVQEIFITMWQKKTLEGVLDKNKLVGYLVNSIKFKSLRLRSTIKHTEELNEDILSVPDEKDVKFKVPDYSFLPERQRDAIKAVFFDEMDRKEFAKQTGISINTLNVHLFLAYKSFQKKYSKEHFVEE